MGIRKCNTSPFADFVLSILRYISAVLLLLMFPPYFGMCLHCVLQAPPTPPPPLLSGYHQVAGSFPDACVCSNGSMLVVVCSTSEELLSGGRAHAAA